MTCLKRTVIYTASTWGPPGKAKALLQEDDLGLPPDVVVIGTVLTVVI